MTPPRTRYESPLVSAEWLHENLRRPDLIVLDASLAAPASPIQIPLAAKTNPSGSQAPEPANLTAHAAVTVAPGHSPPPWAIPGALIFDLENEFSVVGAPFPHTCPSPESFEASARKLGISNDSLLVVYDTAGIYSSPRAWWMFRAMGHSKVKVLDGGLPAWMREGYSAGIHGAIPKLGNFTAKADPEAFRNFEWMKARLEDPAFEIVDARSAERFECRAPEPRPGLRSGTIPGSINVPFASVLDQGRMKAPELLRAIFPPTEKERVFSCGSGVTACVDALAAVCAGATRVSVYDGSWAEWGACFRDSESFR